MYLLNIGLRRSKHSPTPNVLYGVQEAVAALFDVGLRPYIAGSTLVLNGRLLPYAYKGPIPDDEEPTFVVAFIGNSMSNVKIDTMLMRLAEALEQDCIAVVEHHVDGQGIPGWYDGCLIGPRANEWPAFNPAYVLDLMGNPIA